MDKNLYPLNKKIEEIGSAIIYSDSNFEMKLPTQIITTLKVDNGIIWFMIPRSDFNVNCEKIFPAQLNYYRKGKLFYLNVYGNANLFSPKEQLACLGNFSEEMKAMLNFKMMLGRLSVLSIDLYVHQEKEKKGWLNHSANYLYESLFPPSVHESFHFSGVH